LTKLAELYRTGQSGQEQLLTASVTLRINEEGLLTAPSHDPLLSALIGVRADRIRGCAVCRRIFVSGW
jgi:hypothetical protein